MGTARFVVPGLMVAAFAGPAAFAQSTIVWTTNYYAVTGATITEIRRSIAQARPWRNNLDAYTSWHIDSRFHVGASPEGCRCTSFTTTTRIKTTLPRWLRPTNVSPETVRAWTSYFNALRKHEDGHAQRAIAAATEQHRQVNRLGAEPDCHSMRHQISKVAQEVLAEHRRREREYDRETDHGKKEGAVLPGTGPPESRRKRPVAAPP